MEEIIQGSEEWFSCRLGKVTASRIADVMSKVKSGESAGVRNYRAQLVCERLTGTREEGYTNAAMQRGIDMEPLARECYEFIKGVEVTQIAFVDHPTVPMSGASPDGLVGEDGLVEIKCPGTAQHIDYFRAQYPPDNYIKQMQWQMACVGSHIKWCDFVSYDPRLPEEMQLLVVRIPRDDAMINEIEKEVLIFNQSVEIVITELRTICDRNS